MMTTVLIVGGIGVGRVTVIAEYVVSVFQELVK